MLDSFFGSLCVDGSLVREVSDRAFANARSRLHMPALSWLNDQVVVRADGAGLVPRWQGLGLVAAYASLLMSALRQCHRARSLAGTGSASVCAVPARAGIEAPRGRAPGL